MEFLVNIPKEHANFFLRALWSQIRTHLGNGGWNFTPHKDGPKKLIHFGWLSAESLKEPLSVSINYKERGSISSISLASKELDQNQELKEKLSFCVTNAVNFEDLKRKVSLSSFSKALEFSIGSYKGGNFEITPTANETLNSIILDIHGFDEKDLESEAQATFNKVLDLISVETQSVYSYASYGERGEVKKTPEIFTEEILWYGTNRPILDKNFTISEKAKELIDSLAEGTSDNVNKYLKACRLFHSAHKYLMLRYEREKLNISEQISRLGLPNEEIAAVLYMSALEVASDIDAEKPKKCEECGNTVYSISSRVLSYVQSFEADDRTIKNYYKDRSIYLHAGGFFSDQSYTGTTIPQLDMSSESGCKNHIPMKNLLAVSDVVSFCLRQHLQAGIC